jgi:endonuclease/exonuclease/phosphatase family metal-dependent hydrolase
MPRLRLSLPDRARRTALALAFCAALPTLGAARELKVATWNLEWLTERPAGDPALPEDVKPRRPGDFDRLRDYAAKLDADVVAIQEVDSRPAAARVLPPDRYSIHLTHDHVLQRVGIAVRRGLSYDVEPDVTALELAPGDRLRSGADIALHLPAGTLRILAVHLKTGCADSRLTRRGRPACTELRAQVAPLQAWIAARRQEGVPFLIMGDFNRHMEGKDQLWAALAQAAPLLRATEGRSSPCWGGESFIDHIIAGGAARSWVQADTLRVLVFHETGEDWKDRLSDHCPVSVRLNLPDVPP